MPNLDRYQDPQLCEALAGDYVLGTMGGRARRRFGELMAARVYIQQAVTDWEQRLNPLGSRVQAVAPHPRVWRKIRREVAADRQRRQPSVWQSLMLWRTTAFAAMLALGGALVYQAMLPHAITLLPSYVAVLVDESQAPMIVATATRQPQRLVILKIERPKIRPDKDLELWAIPEVGGAPISIGVLSADRKTLIELDQRAMRLMPETGVLAISQEPKGGSPTGSPTGPVVYQGKLTTL